MHEILTIANDSPSVSQSVCYLLHAILVWKDGWTDQVPACGGDSWVPKEHVLDVGFSISPDDIGRDVKSEADAVMLV